MKANNPQIRRFGFNKIRRGPGDDALEVTQLGLPLEHRGMKKFRSLSKGVEREIGWRLSAANRVTVLRTMPETELRGLPV